jgi:hypothetical protein
MGAGWRQNASDLASRSIPLMDRLPRPLWNMALTLATRNVNDFRDLGVTLFNPWNEAL